METKRFRIQADRSRIEWVGRKVTGSHNGTIAVKEGWVSWNGTGISAGRIVADTTNITILDITDPALNDRFAAHLASDDFFSSGTHPEAVLEIQSVDGTAIRGSLTIKGITHPVTFTAAVHLHDDKLSATAHLLVDRTRYNMKFRSGNFFTNLGDTLIYDEFQLNVAIEASLVQDKVYSQQI